jgi:hypothetical protein
MFEHLISSTEKDFEYHNWAAGPPTDTENRYVFLNGQVYYVIQCYPMLFSAIQCYPLLSDSIQSSVGYSRLVEKQLLLLLLLLLLTTSSDDCSDPPSAQAFYIMNVCMFYRVYFLSSSLGYVRKLVMDCGFCRSGMTLRHRVIGSRHFVAT